MNETPQSEAPALARTAWQRHVIDPIAAQLTPEHRAVYEQKMTEHTQKLSDLLLGDQGSPAPAAK